MYTEQVASFDEDFGAPSCRTVGSNCDTESLIEGRGKTGPNGSEPNFPNTIDNCKDGVRGTYRKHGSIDRLVVKSEDGNGFKVGKSVIIEATVFTRRKDLYYADFYYTPDATDPNWIFMGEVFASNKNGFKVLQTEVTLFLPGTLQAIRVNLRKGERNSGSSCSSGNRDDVDDIVFSVINER